MDNKNNIAILRGKGIPISTKMSVEICRIIKNKPISKARRILQDVVDMKRPLEFTRFNADLSHKPGMASGRYPINASKEFLRLLNSVQSNAENKGLNVNNLFVTHAKADKAEARWHSGRSGRTKMKNTHVELIVEERTNVKEGKK